MKHGSISIQISFSECSDADHSIAESIVLKDFFFFLLFCKLQGILNVRYVYKLFSIKIYLQ